MQKKTVVIGLDGVPYNLVLKLVQQGICPNLSKLLSLGSLHEMKSTHPAVSKEMGYKLMLIHSLSMNPRTSCFGTYF